MGERDPDPSPPDGQGHPSENVSRPADQARRADELIHDLNNSLASIVAFSHLIRIDRDLPPELRRHAELLVDEAGRTRRLVEEILGAERAAAVGPRAPRESAATPGLVLVVDDEPAIREFLVRALQRHGYAVKSAVDGPSALQMVDRELPEAILCDHRMISMSGTDFLAAALAAHPELAGRFALMSGDIEHPDLRAIARSRGVALLAKPFDMTNMLRVLDRLMDRGGPAG